MNLVALREDFDRLVLPSLLMMVEVFAAAAAVLVATAAIAVVAVFTAEVVVTCDVL